MATPTEPEHHQIVTELQPRIRVLCREHLPKWARADAAQDCTVHLLTIGPAAKPTRASLKTYLSTCAHNFIIDQRRRIDRGRAVDSLTDIHPAPDTSADRAVEELAALIVDAPHAHLTGFKAKLIRAVTDYPGATGAELADRLDISITTLWPALSRIRSEIVELLEARCA